MKRTIVISLLSLLLVPCSMRAQERDTQVQMKLDEVKAQLVEFDTEHMLDSLDQEKLPKLVSGGVLAGANVSNFIITRDHQTMGSHMRIGGELGGFLDFRLTKHFSIQPQVLFTAQQNYFKEKNDTTNHLWSFGMDIPVYFLGRFGNLSKGYLQFGGGIFTHFTFASNVGKYKNVDSAPEPSTQPAYDYSRLYTLHNNHFGLCLTVGYEFPFGMQINAHYKVSLSDIAGFYSENKGKEIADALIYPQAVSLMIGYRWK